MVSHDFVTDDSLCCDSVFYSRLKIVYRCLVFYIKHCVSVHCQTKTVDQSKSNLDMACFNTESH